MPAWTRNCRRWSKASRPSSRPARTPRPTWRPDLAGFDKLLAKHAGEKTDAVAQILYMKAMLYIQVLDNRTRARRSSGKSRRIIPTPAWQKRRQDAGQDGQAGRGEKNPDAALAPGSAFPDFSEKDLSRQPHFRRRAQGQGRDGGFLGDVVRPVPRANCPTSSPPTRNSTRKGFDIIGVSLDSDHDKLDAFLKQQDGMTWPQFFDGQGWSNKLAAKYGVESIPFTILVGADGKIIGTDLRGEALGARRERSFGKEINIGSAIIPAGNFQRGFFMSWRWCSAAPTRRQNHSEISAQTRPSRASTATPAGEVIVGQHPRRAHCSPAGPAAQR